MPASVNSLSPRRTDDLTRALNTSGVKAAFAGVFSQAAMWPLLSSVKPWRSEIAGGRTLICTIGVRAVKSARPGVAASMLQPGHFKDEGRPEDRPVQRSNLDRHVLSFIEWREVLGQTRQGHRSFDLSRPLISEFKTPFVRI